MAGMVDGGFMKNLKKEGEKPYVLWIHLNPCRPETNI